MCNRRQKSLVQLSHQVPLQENKKLKHMSPGGFHSVQTVWHFPELSRVKRVRWVLINKDFGSSFQVLGNAGWGKESALQILMRKEYSSTPDVGNYSTISQCPRKQASIKDGKISWRHRCSSSSRSSRHEISHPWRLSTAAPSPGPLASVSYFLLES